MLLGKLVSQPKRRKKMGEGQRRFRRGLGNRSCVGPVLASLSPGEQLMKRAEEPEKRRRAGLYLGSPMNWTVRGRREVGHTGRYKRTTGLESKDLPASYPTCALCPLKWWDVTEPEGNSTVPKALPSPGQVMVSPSSTVPKSSFWSLPPLKGCEKD